MIRIHVSSCGCNTVNGEGVICEKHQRRPKAMPTNKIYFPLHVTTDGKGIFDDKDNVLFVITDTDRRKLEMWDELVEAAEFGLREAEEWIHDQFDGTRVIHIYLEKLAPIRKVLANAAAIERDSKPSK